MKIQVLSVFQLLLRLSKSLKSDPVADPFKTSWPLQEGFVSLSIQNLNVYVKQFSGCLMHIYNYNGSEILHLTESVVLTRFDVFGYRGNKNYSSDVYYTFC